MLKVVVATRLYTPEVGAAAFRLKALVDALVENGADVHVMTTRAPQSDAVFKPNYKLSRWPVLRDAGGNVRGYVQYLSYDAPAFFRLLAVRADVVVSEPPPTTGIVVALTSMLHRRPFVYYAADVWTEALSAMQVPMSVKKLMGAVEGFVLRRASTVIAVSEPVADQVAKFGVLRDKIVTVGNGIDTTVFNPDGRVETGVNPYFVYTGTMSEWQGASIFIDALARVREEFPSVELRFFGQGTDEEHLQFKAATVAPDAVHFGGVVSPIEAASWIRGAVGALVSIKPDQGYDFAKPTKIYAAAGCGTPVVFAGRGDGAAVVTENSLGISADYTVEAVAAAMSALLSGNNGDRAARVEWVLSNASLRAAGKVAAMEVLEAAVTLRRKR